MQLLYVLFQLSMIYMFVTGSVCSPETQNKVPTVDLPTGTPRGKKPRHKIWKRNMRQYYLMRRVRRRPVWRPVRDPLRKWYRPETWCWRRRVPTDAQHCKPKRYRPRRCRRSHSDQTPYSGNKHSTSKSKRNRKRKKNKIRKETIKKMNARPPRHEGWESEASPEERFERIKPKVLHVPDVMYGLQMGVDLDEFVSHIDPLKQFRILSKLSGGPNDFFVKTVSQKKDALSDILTGNPVHDALIAAAHLTNTLPTQLQKDTILKEIGPTKLSSKALRELTRRRSVYFSNRDDLPIVIDTGGSKSVTPDRDDFIGEIRMADISDLQGLSASTAVIGIGTVRWTIRDVFGSVRTIETEAYYVPSAAIRLFSPQKYFQEQQAGSLWCDAKRSVLTLADGSALEFPYNSGSNLPLMLPDKITQMGLTFEDSQLFESIGTSEFVTVADDVNENIPASQKELLKWHWKLGHVNFKWIQKLATTPRKPTDGIDMPILKMKEKKTSSCLHPKCAACQMAKQTRRNPGVSVGTPIPEKEMSLRQGILEPGDMVSIDQYVSALPGRLPSTKGKEPKSKKYNGGTLFVDHATSHIYLRHQVSLKVGDTLRTKRAFERFAAECGVSIKAYRADNVPFAAEEFVADLDAKGQTIDYSGTGAHHQNGVAERAIQTVTRWARAMLMHAVIHWPDQADLELWPFALEYAVYLWNNLPNPESLMAPIELFASSKFTSYEHLHRMHVFGCPTYVLDPKLQDGKKLPKWSPRSRRGQYLGPSPNHSTTIGRILNLRTGHVSPQFHCVYDDQFSTVSSVPVEGALDDELFYRMDWTSLVEAGCERIIDDEFDLRSNRQQLPELSDEWLTPAERRVRQISRQQRRNRRFPIPATQRRSGPVSAPEGDGRREMVESEMTPSRSPVAAMLPDTLPDPDDATSASSDDDDLSLLSLPEDIDADQFPLPDADVEMPELEESDSDKDEADGGPDSAMPRRGRRDRRKNRRYWNDDVQVELPKKAPRAALNRQYLNTMNWNLALSTIRSNNLKSMMAQMQQDVDPDDGTLDWMNPMIFGAKANSEDAPTWEQAMNGPDREGYWKACEKEIKTLGEDKDAWDVVKREPWMNVLPSTWAFKCKRFPDGMIRKLKARFCCRGDRQIEGVDYFETFAPVVNWTTVRLMLILSIVLGLATRQVDYTAAFVHAPIDKDPDWDNLSKEEQNRRGVYLEMPRGFTEPGKVLKLKRSLYGLKQSPRNFFQHLKGKLEGIGFESARDVDPCLFISDKVICLVYVDDTLFYSPRQEYIDDVVRKLEEEGMDLETEDDVAGFLGVHIERNDKNGTIKLTQKGLIKRIIETLEIDHLHGKETPATAEPLVLDEDGEPPDGPYSYPSVVGMLQYLQAHSRPDVTYAVSQCARFTHRTRRSHEVALERIGQYLKKTADEGLILRPSKEFNIECFVDADFAGLWPYEDKQDPSCVKSRTGFVICVADCPVIWSSKLQTDIATSTMEAEYNGMSTSMRDVLPFRRLFLAVARAVGLSEETLTAFKTTVWEDNNGALTLANMEPGRMTPRSKHYAIKYHWFRSHLKPNSIEIHKIDTNLQKADIFTKGLRVEKFKSIRQLLCGW